MDYKQKRGFSRDRDQVEWRGIGRPSGIRVGAGLWARSGEELEEVGKGRGDW